MTIYNYKLFENDSQDNPLKVLEETIKALEEIEDENGLIAIQQTIVKSFHEWAQSCAKIVANLYLKGDRASKLFDLYNQRQAIETQIASADSQNDKNKDKEKLEQRNNINKQISQILGSIGDKAQATSFERYAFKLLGKSGIEYLESYMSSAQEANERLFQKVGNYIQFYKEITRSSKSIIKDLLNSKEYNDTIEAVRKINKAGEKYNFNSQSQTDAQAQEEIQERKKYIYLVKNQIVPKTNNFDKKYSETLDRRAQNTSKNSTSNKKPTTAIRSNSVKAINKSGNGNELKRTLSAGVNMYNSINAHESRCKSVIQNLNTLNRVAIDYLQHLESIKLFNNAKSHIGTFMNHLKQIRELTVKNSKLDRNSEKGAEPWELNRQQIESELQSYLSQFKQIFKNPQNNKQEIDSIVKCYEKAYGGQQNKQLKITISNTKEYSYSRMVYSDYNFQYTTYNDWYSKSEDFINFFMGDAHTGSDHLRTDIIRRDEIDRQLKVLAKFGKEIDNAISSIEIKKEEVQLQSSIKSYNDTLKKYENYCKKNLKTAYVEEKEVGNLWSNLYASKKAILDASLSSSNK